MSGFALMDEDSDDPVCVGVLVSCKLIYQHHVTLAIRGCINLKLGTCALCLKNISTPIFWQLRSLMAEHEQWPCSVWLQHATRNQAATV